MTEQLYKWMLPGDRTAVQRKPWPVGVGEWTHAETPVLCKSGWQVSARSYANTLGDALARTEEALVALQEKVDAVLAELGMIGMTMTPSMASLRGRLRAILTPTPEALKEQTDK